MVEVAKKRMFLTELAYEIYSCFEEEWAFNIKIECITEKKDIYEILIKYKVNPNQKKEKEYYDYINAKDYNGIIRLENRYNIGIYNGVIAKLISERLKKEAKLYD